MRSRPRMRRRAASAAGDLAAEQRRARAGRGWRGPEQPLGGAVKVGSRQRRRANDASRRALEDRIDPGPAPGVDFDVPRARSRWTAESLLRLSPAAIMLKFRPSELARRRLNRAGRRVDGADAARLRPLTGADPLRQVEPTGRADQNLQRGRHEDRQEEALSGRADEQRLVRLIGRGRRRQVPRDTQRRPRRGRRLSAGRTHEHAPIG